MEQKINQEKIKEMEKAVQKLHPDWPQVKARWMAVKLLLPPQESQ